MSTFSKINSELITRYLRKELVPKERSFLVGWLEESPDNREFLFGLKETFAAGRWDTLSEQADTENEWIRFNERMGSRRTSVRFRATPFVRWSLVAASLLLFFILGNQWKNIVGKPAIRYFSVETKAGEQTLVSLADGSVVRLNSRSKLSYAHDFDEGNRTVCLEGEAFFEVRNNEESPFSVDLGDYVVKVLGTHFNVSAYKSDSVFTTTLEKGKVKILDVKADPLYSAILKPGEQFVYKTNTGKHSIVNADMDCALSWANGKLVFKNTSLWRVLILLERKFGYTFHVENLNLNNLVYTATIEKESLEDILFHISVVTPQVHYEIDKQTQTVRIR